jgi:hypothetical protein
MELTQIGEVGSPTFPHFPTFNQVTIPLETWLHRCEGRSMIRRRVIPTKVWRGLIRPFETDSDAVLVSRALAAERPLDVHGGYVLPPFEAKYLRSDNREVFLTGICSAFDVLILEFSHTPHPWIFSLSPRISSSRFPNHPHLRRDRELMWEDEMLHGLCVYSAAEFDFDPQKERLEQYLAQASLFLANHAIWAKTRALCALPSNIPLYMFGDPDMYSTLPARTCVQRWPGFRTAWIGYWPSPSAINGRGHLSLDSNGPCWCGDGRLYRNCHMAFEETFYAKPGRNI